MFYTRTRHFPLFAAACGEMTFCDVRAPLYSLPSAGLILRIVGRNAMIRADPWRTRETARRHFCYLDFALFGQVSLAHMCCYTRIHSAACRKHAHMCTHISGIFARARDVRAEAWGVLHKFTIIKIGWINAIDTVCDCHRAYFFEYVEYWYRYISNVFAITRQLFVRHLVWRELGKLLEKEIGIEVITIEIALRISFQSETIQQLLLNYNNQ